MIPAPLPPNESERLASLRALGVLDTPREEAFDALARVAARVCQTPVCLVSLVDAQRQWFKANIGLERFSEAPRHQAFCAHAILGSEVMEVPDAQADPRFCDNPLVLGDPVIRFYAGAPIRLSNGAQVGSLCVIDRIPRSLSAEQKAVLRDLASAAAEALEWHRERTQHKEQAQSQAAQLQNIIRATQIGTWRWNIVTGDMVINDQWALMLGYALADLEPMHIHAFGLMLEPSDLTLAMLAMECHLEDTSRYYECELRMRHRHGHWVWILSRGQVVEIGADGRPHWVAGTHQDISERKKNEAALQRATQEALTAVEAKSRFLANMSHEIRTPLNAVQGMLTLLRRSNLDERQADYALKAETAARSLLAIVNDILDFSKAEAGMLELDAQPFYTEDLLQELGLILAVSLGHKPVELLLDVDPALPHQLVGDALRIQQVLVNLGSNAVKFTERGEVRVAVRLLGQSAGLATLEFLVRDTGIGISAENQQKIFTGFTQAEASITRRFGGTGLGLAISRQLVELMGGKLELSSEVGRGSCFRFQLALPVADSEPEPQDTTELVAKSVLIVADAGPAVALLSSQIQALGIDVALCGPVGAAAQELGAPPQGTDTLIFDVTRGAAALEQLLQQLQAGPTSLPTPTPKVIAWAASGSQVLGSVAEIPCQARLARTWTHANLRTALQRAHATAPASQQASKPGPSPGKRLQGLRVLLVEDNPINQQVAQTLLTMEGAVVTLANDGEQSVQAFGWPAQPQRFDAVLMDMQMPVMDGLAASRELHRRMPGTCPPVVAMTANVMAADRQLCLDAGMVEHVGKPFEVDYLVGVLLRVSGYTPPHLEPPHALAAPDAAPDAAQLTAATSGDAAAAALEQAVARMGGHRAVHERLLRQFLNDIPAQQAALALAREPQDAAAVQRCLHTLKGVAATLGLAELAQTMVSLEARAKAGGTGAEVVNLIEEASVALLQAQQFLHERLGPAARAMWQNDVAQAPGQALSEAARRLLQTLAQLVAASDISSPDVFDTLARDHAAELGAVLAPLQDALDSFDFDAAAGLIAQALTNQEVVP